ncbi:hypothetical protein B0T21DRAFT_377395 [Apiosordaria backusii]|uniref:RNase H type-1 domain-containing protein n=1 Tax=Apiosordaria backusii TaxID=314023 RepID=A0AA40A0X8_9PEZI|nr:hypothetical protein B0T21DRAFT_377395 [Apiosordaria backusii]
MPRICTLKLLWNIGNSKVWFSSKKTGLWQSVTPPGPVKPLSIITRSRCSQMGQRCRTRTPRTYQWRVGARSFIGIGTEAHGKHTSLISLYLYNQKTDQTWDQEHVISNGNRDVCDWFVSKIYNSQHAELLAICEALNIVKEKQKGRRKGGHPPLRVLRLFSDSVNALEYVQKGQDLANTDFHMAALQPIVGEIIHLSHRLKELGCSIELRWVPGHRHQVQPHKKADVASRHAAKSGSSR